MIEFSYLPFFLLSFIIPLLVFKNAGDKTVTLARVIRVGSFLFFVLICVSVVAMLVGPSKVGTPSLLKASLSIFNLWDIRMDEAEKLILFSVRFPRIVFAGLVGAALSTAGVIFQGLLRNPLADPYILGISGGAAVGAIIAILTGINAAFFGTSGMAFVGAMLTIGIVYGIARTNRELHSNTILLAGVIVNAFFSAVIMFLVSTSSNASLHGIMFWLMGDLGLAVLDDIPFIGLFLLAGFIVMYVYSRHLNLIVAGEETAMQLGVDVEKTKKILFLTASLVTAVAVSLSGIIGFVGLIIPHIMRMSLGSDHRLLLPASLLFGASFLIVADSIARTIIAPAELPVGVITAMCGAPYFIYLLRRRAT